MWGGVSGAGVGDLAADASRLPVLDARELAIVASVQPPRRVPSGIHGAWIPAETTA